MKKRFVLQVSAVAFCFVLLAAVTNPKISKIFTNAAESFVDFGDLFDNDTGGQPDNNEVNDTEGKSEDENTAGTGEENGDGSEGNNEEPTDPTEQPTVETSPTEPTEGVEDPTAPVTEETTPPAPTTEAPVTEEIPGNPEVPTTDEPPVTEETTPPTPTTEAPVTEAPTTEVPIVEEIIEEPTEDEAGLTNAFDIEALKEAVKADYDNYSAKNSNFNPDSVYKMLDELTVIIVDRKLYPEATPEALLDKVKRQRSYSVNLITSAYRTLYEEQYSFGDDSISLGITGKVNTDVSSDSYKGYEGTSGSGELAPGYINALVKEVKTEKTKIAGEDVDKFREYQVSLGLDLSATPDPKQVKNADIILLIDSSASMSSNLDNAKTNAKYIIDSVFTESYNYSDAESAKIAVISFTNTANIVSGFTNNRNTLNNAISRINASGSADTGASGTNLQFALTRARDLFGIKDGDSVSGNRTKMIIVISDGVVTARSSDQWVFPKTMPYGTSAINFQSGNSLEVGKKRWSYLTNFDWKSKKPVAEMINLPDKSSRLAVQEQAGNESKYRTQQELTEKITALEANYYVGQGIELYSISYADSNEGNSFMNNITKKLNGTPEFKPSEGGAAGYRHAPLSSANSSSISNRAYSASNVKGLVSNLVSKKSETTQSSFNGFTITETLADQFVFDNPNKITVSKAPFGDNKISDSKWRKFSVSGNTLTWTSPEKVDKGTYYINYIVKVKDDTLFKDGADKTLYGPKASDKVSFSKASYVEYKEMLGKSKKHNFSDHKVSVQPNLQIEFTGSSKTVLLGEEFEGIPKIVTGSGYYDYTITQVKSPESSKKVELDKKTNHKAPKAYDVEFDKITLSGNKPGDYKYQLEVKDLVSNQKTTADLEIIAREQILRVNLVDENGGTSLPGAFETRLSASNKDGESEKYYMVGLGNREFRYSDGNVFLKRGTSISAEAYVPYGYEIVSVSDSDGSNDGNVTIDIKESGGKYTGYEQDITIKVRKKTSPMFFYDWSWIIGNKKGSI